MSSLYSYENIDMNDSKNYCIFHEESSHPFSKYYHCKIKINNIEYLSVEHYWQCSKFIHTNSIFKQILNAPTSEEANILGTKHNGNIDKNWYEIRDKIYYKGQRRKFQKNNELKQMLLETKQKHIICINNDTFLGLTMNNNDKHKLNGENNAGIILSKIRDELLLDDSDDDQEKDEKKEEQSTLIQGNVSNKFNQTYSAIFAPFLINVVVRLLNNSNEITLNLNHYIANWGGGINVIRKCCIDHEINPNDKSTNWDTLIDLCCISTPSTHNVWIQLLSYNKMAITNDPIKNLSNLLSRWVSNGQYYRMYGSYPSAVEQELYIQDTIPREISEILNYAIINDVFKDAFISMDKCKRQQPSVSQQASSFVSYLWNMVDKSIGEFIPLQ